VLNRELDADFDLEDFDHVALFDREHEWIEMPPARAAGGTRRCVRALDLSVHFDEGEEMRTEISAKFTTRAPRSRSVGRRARARALADRPRELFRADALKRSAG